MNHKPRELLVGTAYDRTRAVSYDQDRFSDPKGITFHRLEMDEFEKALRRATNDAYDRATDEPSLVASLVELGGECLNVNGEHVNALPDSPSGKRRYIISSVSAHRPASLD